MADETINVSMDQFQSMLAWQKDLIMLREEKEAWESEKKRTERRMFALSRSQLFSGLADKEKEITGLQKSLEHLQEESLAQVQLPFKFNVDLSVATSHHRKHEDDSC